MSFTDLPIIDRYSVNSETSERRFKDVINLTTGFLVKPEYPDKGCDLNVELVTGGTGATSLLFPVQLKSIEKLSLVQENTLISLSFETSRLGYLMNRIPAMGLIIFYSVEEDKCFYDYPDKVYERIMEEKGSHAWKEQKEVHIHIPYVNLLKSETAKEIHQVLLTRFKQSAILHNSYGQKYGLPTFSQSENFDYDFKNPDHIKIFLKEHGMMLVNNYDIDMVFQMVSHVPHMEIYASKDLLILAALAYEESGLYSDSQVFCTKLRKETLEGSEKLIFDFLVLKNNLALGYIDHNTFLIEIQKLSEGDLSTDNSIILKLNITKYQLLSVQAPGRVPARLFKTTNDLFEEINTSTLPEKTKTVLTLLHCENYSHLISHESGITIGEYQIRERLGKPTPKEQRVKDFLEMMQRETRLTSLIQETIKKAAQTGDLSIKAHALSVSVFHFIQQQVNVVAFGIPPLEDIKEILAGKISAAETAYNYFCELSSFKEAYNILCNMLDIIELAERYYNISDAFNKATLYEIKAQIETGWDILPRDLVLLKLIERQIDQKAEPQQNGMPVFKDLSDQQIQDIAAQMHSAMGLPDFSLVHIINEIKAYRMYHKRCDSPNIEIAQFQQPTPSPHSYSRPIMFVLRNKTTGIQTPPGANMDELLTAMRF